MSNLMLFVEENLLYNPEKCYEKDYNIPNVKDDEIHKKGTENIPLISPKSTLPKNACKMDFKTYSKPFSNESTHLKTMEEESGNPFLKSIRKQTEFFNTLLPELFKQILKTNEKFQKQISFIFSYLILKLDSNFLENNYHLPENELKKNYEERLLHISKLLENFVIEKDISMLSTLKAPNNFNTDIGLQFDQNKRMFIPLFANNNNNHVANKKSKINDYNKNKEQYELFESNNDSNNIVLNSEPQIPYVQSIYTDHDKSAIINSCEEKSAKTELKTKTAAFPCQNYNKDISENEVNVFDAILKGEITYNEFDKINLFTETNPFKITLKPKGKNSQYETSNMNIGTSLRNNIIEESSINSTFASTSNITGISNELGYDRNNFNPNSEHYFNMPSKEYINKLKVLGSQEPINYSKRNCLKDVENGLLSLVNVPNKSYINQSCMDSIGMSNIHQQYQATVANSNNYEKANTNFDSKYASYPNKEYTNNNEGNINSDRWEAAAVIENNTELIPIYFRKIEVNDKEIYIFHLDNQGWIQVKDFVRECTNYKTITEFYEKLDNYCLLVTEFKKIKKLYPLFLYDHMILSGPREEVNKGLPTHLINISCILNIMVKLRIISSKSLHGNGVDNRAFFYHACIVMAKYRAFRSSIPKKLK